MAVYAFYGCVCVCVCAMHMLVLLGFWRATALHDVRRLNSALQCTQERGTGITPGDVLTEEFSQRAEACRMGAFQCVYLDVRWLFWFVVVPQTCARISVQHGPHQRIWDGQNNVIV